MLHYGEDISIYTFYKTVGLKGTLITFYNKMRINYWMMRENKNVWVYLFKEDMRSLIKKLIKKVF